MVAEVSWETYSKKCDVNGVEKRPQTALLLIIRDGLNGNLQDFRIPDRFESLKSKIQSNT